MTAKKTKLDWASLHARDIMQTTVFTVSTNTPLSEVERLLSERRIGGVPVTGETGHIVGVVSVRDLIEHYSEGEKSRPGRGIGFYNIPSEGYLDDDIEELEVPEESGDTAGEVMTAQVYTITADADLQGLAKKMADLNIHRILVEDGGKTVGLISTMDILRALAQ